MRAGGVAPLGDMNTVHRAAPELDPYMAFRAFNPVQPAGLGSAFGPTPATHFITRAGKPVGEGPFGIGTRSAPVVVRAERNARV